ncbi:FAD-dependent oxidoreductase [bacterium]|nr:FAD-dependent oxidoreductase [candidate division CSSED10-310 bacterium]
MKPPHIVIIGNGVSANRASEVLRENDPDVRITLISREFFLFYFRHKLPAFITGSIDEDSLIVHDLHFYMDRNIRLRLGQTVQKIDLENKTLFLSHMEMVHYDKLLICSGGQSHIPEIYYPFRSFFTTLKKLSDARDIRKKLPLINRIVIVGGDLTSLRLADALIRSGREVSFILDDFAFWPIESGPDIRHALETALKKVGATVISGDPLERIERISDGDPPEYAVYTRKGQQLRAQMVGAFFGFKPDVDFLIRSGLDIDRGILVDDRLQTTYPDVFAAGDCAQVYAPHLNNYWVSIGWKNAIMLGEIAAANMSGSEQPVSMPVEQRIRFSDLQLKTPWWHAL